MVPENAVAEIAVVENVLRKQFKFTAGRSPQLQDTSLQLISTNNAMY